MIKHHSCDKSQVYHRGNIHHTYKINTFFTITKNNMFIWECNNLSFMKSLNSFYLRMLRAKRWQFSKTQLEQWSLNLVPYLNIFYCPMPKRMQPITLPTSLYYNLLFNCLCLIYNMQYSILVFYSALLFSCFWFRNCIKRVTFSLFYFYFHFQDPKIRLHKNL